MKTKNKILFATLLFLCVLALGLGIYLFPDEAPLPDRQHTAKPAPAPFQAHGESDAHDIHLKESLPPVSHGAPPATDPGKKTSESETSTYVSYPDALIDLLGIDMNALEQQRDAFKNTIIHVSWMDRINEVLTNLDPLRKAAIIKNHTTLLYIKDKLNEAYLTGKIDHETFKKAIADLMKWHQRTYEAILTTAEYEALFEISPEIVDDTIDEIIGQTPEYSFILNQNIGVEEVKEQVQGYKLEEVNSHFKRMVLDRDHIGKQINAGEMTLEQARAALNKSQQAFIARCKEILTEDEINTIFGSVTALETGASQTEPPAVLGDSDETELGFEIENPETSIENVREKVDANKIEDIRFFYQERAKEREDLIARLDAGEITSEELENISNEMDAAFDENCRDLLTDEEYHLIFGNPGGIESITAPRPEDAAEETADGDLRPETPENE